MTIKETIKEFQTQIETFESMILYNKDFGSKSDNTRLEERMEAAKMAVSALETQIPKKPIVKGALHDWYCCPLCGDELCKKYDYEKRYPNCHWCGQAIEWNESQKE